MSKGDAERDAFFQQIAEDRRVRVLELQVKCDHQRGELQKLNKAIFRLKRKVAYHRKKLKELEIPQQAAQDSI